MMKAIFKILVLCASIVLFAACEAPEDVNIIAPDEAANEAQIEPLGSIKPVLPSAENNYGYKNAEELRNAILVVNNAIEKYAFLAIVKDIKVTYPEWPFGDPVDPDDGFVSGVQRYEVNLVEILRGELPQSFSYELYTESANVVIHDNPYPVGFCYSNMVDGFVAEVFLGRMFDDPGFLQLFLDQWDKAEPVDLSDKPCWFDKHHF